MHTINKAVKFTYKLHSICIYKETRGAIFVNESSADTKFGRKSYLGPSQLLQWQLAFGLTVQRTVPIDNF